jgi:hypothetical protein
VRESEKIIPAIERLLGGFGIMASVLWAAEQTYTIYNRRFEMMQIIGVYAAEAAPGDIRLDPQEQRRGAGCAAARVW